MIEMSSTIEMSTTPYPWYLPPQSSREDRIVAMEVRMDSLLSYQSNERNKRHAQWFSQQEKIENLNIGLDEILDKIKELEDVPNGTDDPQYSELETLKGNLKRQIDEMSRKIAAEKRTYEKECESSMEGNIIRILQRMIEIEKIRGDEGEELI
ncbi:hypothetical protein RUND412_009049 [Rhizina undulata]